MGEWGVDLADPLVRDRRPGDEVRANGGIYTRQSSRGELRSFSPLLAAYRARLRLGRPSVTQYQNEPVRTHDHSPRTNTRYTSQVAPLGLAVRALTELCGR